MVDVQCGGLLFLIINLLTSRNINASLLHKKNRFTAQELIIKKKTQKSFVGVGKGVISGGYKRKKGFRSDIGKILSHLEVSSSIPAFC